MKSCGECGRNIDEDEYPFDVENCPYCYNDLVNKTEEANLKPEKVITHIGAYDVQEIEKWIKEGDDETKVPS